MIQHQIPLHKTLKLNVLKHTDYSASLLTDSDFSKKSNIDQIIAKRKKLLNFLKRIQSAKYNTNE